MNSRLVFESTASCVATVRNSALLRAIRALALTPSNHNPRRSELSGGSLAWFAFLMMLVALLPACTTNPPQPVATAVPKPETLAEKLHAERRATLSALSHWSFTGRAAVQRDAEGWSATLHWEQHGEAFRLRIIAPLGRGTFEILREPGKVTLIDPQNNVYSANSPEQLLQEATGWRLPISNIEYWVRGLLAPGESPSQVNLDEGGLLKDFAVRKWRVSVLEYLSVDSLAMPRKLFMNYDTTKIRLVVNRWNLNADASD